MLRCTHRKIVCGSKSSECATKMDDHKLKDDIKTSFLIANSFNAMVGGLFPLALGVGIALSEGGIWPLDISLGFGAPMAAFAALGYYAAFNENKKMLHIYSSIMGLVAALEVAAVVASSMLPFTEFDLDTYIIIFGNIHVGVTLVAVSWSVALAKRAPDEFQCGVKKSSRLPFFLKYLGYGALVVFIFIICSYVY